MDKNIILFSDSYKVGHWVQYPPKTQNIYSYFESRGGKFPATKFFGLQYYLKEYLAGKVITEENIIEADQLFAKHFGNNKLFNRIGWESLLAKYGGRLPVSIKAVPEGMLIPTGNVLMTIENTDPEFYWLTNYLETLLVQVWYGTTVCTLSYYMKEMITRYLEKTGDAALINFKLHDFGFRGVSSVESAAVGGAAHLVNFMGTDTMAALMLARSYYSADMPGYSIPASEHSTICAWGRENESLAMQNMLEQYPEGLVACVSDSYDIYNACEMIWGTLLKDKVMQRNGTLVVRPDSGEPPVVVVKVLDILGEKFGYTRNKKGYKVLDPHIRVIQGDGCNYEMCERVLEAMKACSWSADNIVFGMGGGLLQNLNRDTQRFAFKCSAVNIDGEWRDVFKSPITDTGKISKAGRLRLVPMDNAAGGISYQTVNELANVHGKDILVEVFRNGEILKEYTFDEIRQAK